MSSEVMRERDIASLSSQDVQDQVSGADSSLTRHAHFSDQLVQSSHSIEAEGAKGASYAQLVTFKGTIKSGLNPGQLVEVHLRLTDQELKKFNQEDITSNSKCSCGLDRGLHVIFLSIIFIPFSWLSSLFVSFYLGTLTWYNLIVYLSEERTVWHKIGLCPLLILTFPFTVGISAFAVSIYASLIQISWCIKSWCHEIQDFEKGFYGWVCIVMGFHQCSPYSVVVLSESGEMKNLPSPVAV
ncbi:hypothetical protein CHS0354_034679 [Potamilus streckersoni]|uniref:Transmembrane protein 169 n=1 Tax=Potamilus streckersoni TaxID=2493646 RepID=A0AAE0TC54_9BIVA|nr:hypothetical protein CHS0354_034679 [Potamilus streckersoni]